MRRITCLWRAVAAVGIIFTVARRLVAYRIDDHSMEPTLRPGDWVVGVRRGRVRPGDVVVFEHPRQPGFEMVKRAVGGPGEEVAGTILGPDEFWVLGDNPAAGSVDGGTLGPIPLAALRARLLWRYRPWPPARVR